MLVMEFQPVPVVEVGGVGDVDAVRGNHLGCGAQVQGGDRLFGADAVTVDDVAGDAVGTPEEAAREGDVSALDLFADLGGGDDQASVHNGGEGPRYKAHVREGCGVPLRWKPKRKLSPTRTALALSCERRVFSANSSADIATRALSKGRMWTSSTPCARSNCFAFFDGVQESGCAVGGYDACRVGMERQNGGFKSEFTSSFNGAAQQCLVSNVDTVEDSDGDGGHAGTSISRPS